MESRKLTGNDEKDVECTVPSEALSNSTNLQKKKHPLPSLPQFYQIQSTNAAQFKKNDLVAILGFFRADLLMLLMLLLLMSLALLLLDYFTIQNQVQIKK